MASNHEQTIALTVLSVGHIAFLGIRSRFRQRPKWTLAAVILLAFGAWVYVNRPRVAQPVTIFVPGIRTANQPKRLIVYAHSLGHRIAPSGEVIEQLVRDTDLAGSDVLLFNPRATRLTRGPSDVFATRLRAEVDAQWIRAGGYDDIILSGASLGSLIVRQAYLTSAGRDPRQPRTVPWSDRVSRIVLLAGIGRGINLEDEGYWKWAIRFGRYVPLVRESIVYDQLRGAEFITAIRVAWIRHFAELNRAAARDSAAPRVPTVVQLLGTQDDHVRREDNIDFVQFPNAYHLDVPGARHGDIFRYGDPSDSLMRYTLFREAFVSPALPHASRGRQRADSVTRVVFLLHGVRSTRSWVRQLAPLLRARMPGAEVVESSYGQISVLGFVLPSVRREKRRWLQDQYSEYLARYPSATFDVVAHSNGTHVVGETLARLPVIRFDRVALLSSVLPAEYPWRQRRVLGQVGTVRSDRAQDDLIVALVCSGLHGLGMTDVGTSGWKGFDESGEFLFEPPPVSGGHNATTAPDNLASIASFMAGEPVASRATSPEGNPTLALRRLSRAAPWLVFLFFVLTAFFLLAWAARGSVSARRIRFASVAGTALVVAILLDVL